MQMKRITMRSTTRDLKNSARLKAGPRFPHTPLAIRVDLCALHYPSHFLFRARMVKRTSAHVVLGPPLIQPVT
jgi:hypothetical protein